MILLQDETIVRLFPPLRMAWAPMGTQARVPITGENARRVIFGAINIRTGHRVLRRTTSLKQSAFATFLRELHRRYPGRRLWLLLDKHGSHKAAVNRRLARTFGIELVPLPRQCPELNAMDQLWRETKRCVSANRQFASIGEHAQAVEGWITRLTPRQALRKAGVLSKNYWLRT